MCIREENSCEHPERLKGHKPGECSQKQIEECHGDAEKHTCCEDE